MALGKSLSILLNRDPLWIHVVDTRVWDMKAGHHVLIRESLLLCKKFGCAIFGWLGKANTYCVAATDLSYCTVRRSHRKSALIYTETAQVGSCAQNYFQQMLG